MHDGFAPVPRRRAVSMTSLIDIIFLLLLFFMLSTSFSRHGDFALDGAGAGAGSDTSAPRFLRLTAQAITLDARPTDLAALPDLLSGVSAPVIVAPQPDVTSQRLIDVLAVLKRVPDLSVRVLGG